MALIGANELKKKMIIVVEGAPYLVLEVFFATPSARGASTMARARLRHLLNGAVLDKNFKTSEKFEEADVEKTKASFLYSDADAYHFMDDTTYEEFALSLGKLGEQKFYIKEGVPLDALKYNGSVVSLEFPVYVELKITEAEPVKSDAGGSNVTKQAKLETGLEIKVPLYIKEGDLVKISTLTGEFSGRA